jgi:hypothetical protein
MLHDALRTAGTRQLAPIPSLNILTIERVNNSLSGSARIDPIPPRHASQNPIDDGDLVR